ncbi:MAG: RNHCP domain-containing protein [Candidatus Komeilibacteria bacterium]|nr:RNHCP domain-containing protein [Candidatus Komeilibacteria bacterium]
MGQTFAKKIEDFSCAHCGTEVKGSGFTNHCPSCLWSKHVDRFPGDREEPCQGMMEPIELILEGETENIVHRCGWCGMKRKNKTAPNDRREAIIALSYKGGRK